MLFKDLPTEIHLAIISHLDYTALLKFDATNHHFRSLQGIKQKKAALSDFEKEVASSPDKEFKDSDALAKRLKSGTHLPCYFCLKFLNPATHFESFQTKEKFALGQDARIRRRCARCTFFHGLAVFTEIGVFKESEIFVSKGATWIGCVACQETKRYPYTDLQKQAWTAAHLCAECYWFKIAAWALGRGGEDYVIFDGSKTVRVTSMSKKAAKELCEELQSRTRGTDSEEYIAAVAAIERAAEPPPEHIPDVFRSRVNNTPMAIRFEEVVEVLAESSPPASVRSTEISIPKAPPTVFGLLAFRVSAAWASVFARQGLVGPQAAESTPRPSRHSREFSDPTPRKKRARIS